MKQLTASNVTHTLLCFIQTLVFGDPNTQSIARCFFQYLRCFMEPDTLSRSSESSSADFSFYKILIESVSSCLICTREVLDLFCSSRLLKKKETRHSRYSSASHLTVCSDFCLTRSAAPATTALQLVTVNCALISASG